MPGRCADQGELVDLRVLVPVEFDDALVGNTPLPQVRADTEWNRERGPLGSGQRDDRVDVEVVVVVVADDDRIQRRQRVQWHRWRMRATRPDDVRRRAAFAPDRVGEHAVAVDFQQGRRMTEPADRDSARGGLEGSRLGGDQRDVRGRPARRAATDQLPQDVSLFFRVDIERGRFQVDEYAVVEVR